MFTNCIFWSYCLHFSELDSFQLGMVPPVVERGPNTISMVVDRWEEGQIDQFSAVRYINGYPWRMRLHKREEDGEFDLCMRCEKSMEAELWDCGDTGYLIDSHECYYYNFNSWSGESEDCVLRYEDSDIVEGQLLEARFFMFEYENGESCRRRPILDPLDPLDGILVIGEEKKKIHVNKKALSSQSPFFDRLFNGDFKEKNMQEIPIGDVEYEEFHNIIKLMFRFDDASLSDENALRVLELADRFELKIVEDIVTSYLLSPSSSSSFSRIQMLLIADQYKIDILKKRIIRDLYPMDQLREVREDPEFNRFSLDIVSALFDHAIYMD